MIRTQFSLPIKVIRSDNGGEYIYSKLSSNSKTEWRCRTEKLPYFGNFSSFTYWSIDWFLSLIGPMWLHMQCTSWIECPPVFITTALHWRSWQTMLLCLPCYNYLHECSGAQLMFTFTRTNIVNWCYNPCVLHCVFFRFAPQQKGINVMIQLLAIRMIPWMLHSLSKNFSSPWLTPPICSSGGGTDWRTLVMWSW